MQTFLPAKPFVSHPSYSTDRLSALRDLDTVIRNGSIDKPVLPLIRECIPVQHCFTVQCCYGHFVHDRQPDTENFIPPSRYQDTLKTMLYRLAYLTVCIRNNPRGRELRDDLASLETLDPDYIQFGSAGWFWERMVNTYCIQLEPGRMKAEDNGIISMEEALVLEELRPLFFARLAAIIQKHAALTGG